MTYYGDFPANHTAVCMPFDSFAASTGAPSAVTNFANTDILIYKDGGTTQRTSANGITVTTSFDGQTGLQMVVIDLSDNTDAGFYAAGHEYQVGVADVTIDGQTVRFWLGTFSIERANGVLAKLISGAAKVDVTKWLTATPAALSTNGYVQAMLLRWLTDNAAGTPAALSTNGYVQSMLLRWLTDNAGGTPNALIAGRMDSNVQAMANAVIAAATFAAGAIDAAAIAADAIGSSELAASAANEIADAYLDRAAAIEGFTPREADRLMLCALVAKLSGAATLNVLIRNIGDTKNRIDATVDADGNRSAVTLDAT